MSRKLTCTDVRKGIEQFDALLFPGEEVLEDHLSACLACGSWWGRRLGSFLDASTGGHCGDARADLAARIKARLRQEEEACVYYSALKSPVGNILMAGRRQLVCGIAIRCLRPADYLKQLAERYGVPALRQPKRLQEPLREIREYFSGKRKTFDLTVDLSWMTAFQRDVLQYTATIPAGEIRTYGEVAKAIGSHGASRAVGNALGGNPAPIVIPCHRVVASDGRIGGYSGGGPEIKRRLLRLEGVCLSPEPRSLFS